jgi:DivIVA domain-containing protein
MITPQSIREKTFEKAVFGGYDMSSVDDFLENVASDFAALQKDAAVLKGKMKVLVEKIEEYRATKTPCAWPCFPHKRWQTRSWPRPRKQRIHPEFAKAEAESLCAMRAPR